MFYLMPASFFFLLTFLYFSEAVKVCPYKQSQRDFVNYFFSLVGTGKCIFFLYVQMSSDVMLTNDTVNQTISIVS